MQVYRKIILLIFLVAFAALFLVACDAFVEVDQTLSIQVEEFTEMQVRYGEEIELKDLYLIVIKESGKEQRIPITSDMLMGFNKNQLGLQAVDVVYDNFATKIYVEVTDIEVLGLSVREKPEEIRVTQGMELSLAGVILDVEYENTTIQMSNIKSQMIVGYHSNLSPGKHTIHIEYAGKRVGIEIIVIERVLVGMKINTPPKKLQYFVGEELIPNGLSLKLTYDNKTQQLLAYEDIPEGDITFTYNFLNEGAACPIFVEYGGYRTLANDLTAVIAEPKVVSLEIQSMPKTRGISVGGELHKTQITEIVERDQIDWSTGSMLIKYDNGSSREITLEKNEVSLYFVKNSNITIAKDYRYTETGAKKIYVKYGNETPYTEIDIYVVPKSPFALYVEDINGKLNRIYYEGERITTDFLRYNILYNNATYEYDIDDVRSWGGLTERLLSDDGSTLNLSMRNTDENGYQHINFAIGNITAGFVVKVSANSPKMVRVIEPKNNCASVGDLVSSLDFEGSSVYVELLYGDPILLSLKNLDLSAHPEIEISYENEAGDVVTRFNEEGEHKLVVTYKGMVGKVSIFVYEELPFQIVLSELSNAIFSEFSEIPITSMTMNVYYPTEFGGERLEYSVPVTEDYLYEYDRYGVGKQTVSLRYKGAIATFEVTINPKNVFAIGVGVLPQKIVYQAGAGQILQTAMRVKYVFEDGTYREEELPQNPANSWSFTGYDLTTPGKQTVTVTRDFGSYSKSFCYDIEVLQPANLGVFEIAFDDSQRGLLQVDSKKVLIVGHREEINTNYYVEYVDSSGNNQVEIGVLKLKVRYSEGGEFQEIDLIPEYITRASYDKNHDIFKSNGQLERFREVTIEYGGKQTTLNIYITEREIQSISVYEMPSNINYVIGQELCLDGGVLKIEYSPSPGNSDDFIDYDTYAVLPMTNLFVINSGYDKMKTQSGSLWVPQEVQLKFARKTANISLHTYDKVSPVENLKMSKITQQYGMVSAPIITITHAVSTFLPPQAHVVFEVDGIWQDALPQIPGEYDMKLVVIENEYFRGGEYELTSSYKFRVNKKAIDIQVNFTEKDYGMIEPELTWSTTNNTFLEPGDFLNIQITREPGEVVKFDENGNVTGYKINWSFNPEHPGNQDRYIVILAASSSEFTIKRKVIPETSTINYVPVVGSGNREFSVKYVLNNIEYSIHYEDLTYYNSVTGEKVNNGDGSPLGSPPIQSGEYYVQVSDNYYIEKETSRRHYFVVE